MTLSVESRPEFLHKNNTGTIDVIAGPMFSGKSLRLIYILHSAQYAKMKVQAFKPIIDNRRNPNTINSFDRGSDFPATRVINSREILERLEEDTQVIGVDEAQFMDEELVDVCVELASMGKHVIVAGLHSDFRGEPFGPMAKLLVEADYVEKRQARCTICGGSASRTQRLIVEENGVRPAYYEDPLVVVGEEQYQARCRHHHEVPHMEEKT